MQFSFILPIDRTLSGATTPAQSGPGSDLQFPTLLLEPQHQIDWCHIQDTRCGEVYTPQQNCSWCILQPQPTGQYLVEEEYKSRHNLVKNVIN